MELITFFIVLAVGLYLGWYLRGIIFMATISENPEKIIKLLEEVKKINEQEKEGKPVGKGVEVEPEKIGTTWYAYAKDTGQFLAQGPTLEEAMRIASVRFPNKEFWCNTHPSNLTKQA